MLILKFNEAIKVRRSLFKKNNSLFKTGGFILNNAVYNVIELNKKSLKTDEFILLLNKHKGAVLDTDDQEINDYLKSYLFDCSPYIKRALLCAVANGIDEKRDIILKVTDDNFRFSSEWLDIARKCKSVVLSGSENNDMHIFSDVCFKELGLNVYINDDSLSSQNEAGLLFIAGESGYTAQLTGCINKTIAPDSEYFKVNEAVSKLMSYGVSRVFACSAVQPVPFKKVYVLKD